MVQLIKKGGLRERANRSRSYQGSENTQATLKPNRYRLNANVDCSSPEQSMGVADTRNSDQSCNNLNPQEHCKD